MLIIIMMYLHSNMVRFIIKKQQAEECKLTDLHSNMVRFIIKTFSAIHPNFLFIYIPIWLDLLSIPSISQ